MPSDRLLIHPRKSPQTNTSVIPLGPPGNPFQCQSPKSAACTSTAAMTCGKAPRSASQSTPRNTSSSTTPLDSAKNRPPRARSSGGPSRSNPFLMMSTCSTAMRRSIEKYTVTPPAVPKSPHRRGKKRTHAQTRTVGTAPTSVFVSMGSCRVMAQIPSYPQSTKCKRKVQVYASKKKPGEIVLI
jgi:hypothetical protein